MKSKLLLIVLLILISTVSYLFFWDGSDKSLQSSIVNDKAKKENIVKKIDIQENNQIHRKAHEKGEKKKGEGNIVNDELLRFDVKEYEKTEKFDIPYMFGELHSLLRTREGENFPKYQTNQRFNEFFKAVTESNKKFSEKPQRKLDWIERGPGNVGGRTRAFIVDPTDESKQTWFAGSVAGGIWKTTDKGLNWRNLTPFLPNLATTCLAYSESNPDIIYAGTGEGFMNLDAVNGDGIFKSTDHGETWFHLPSSAKFNSINRIIVNPENANILLCCANDMNISGVQAQRYFQTRNSTIEKSTNGGISWRTVFESGENRVQQIVFDPDNFNIQYATVNGVGIVKSTNAGETWIDASSGIGICQRIEMAVSPTNTNKLYLSVENGAQSDFYMSETGGELWYLVNDIKKNNSWLSSQGWYDNCIAVHPFNENIIYVGGVNIFKVEMQSGQDSIFKVTKIEKNNLSSFLDFLDSGLPYEEGGIGTGEDYWNEKILTDKEYSSVEIRFGANRTQRAHRFYRKGEGYEYKDYVSVPFEVNDVTNFRQLSISFVDENKNGKFDLLEGDVSEMIVIHVLNIGNQPNNSVKENIKHKASFVITARLKEGAEWDADNLPNSKLKIEWGPVYTKKRKTSAVTDGYSQFGNPNHNGIVHVDHHNITMITIDEVRGEFWILNGNDGGVAYSTNAGVNWIETDKNGYNTSQFYGCDKKPGANEYIGGTQDNGTYFTITGEDAHALSKYNYAIGGDGFEAIWHYHNTLKMLGSSQFNTIRKTTNGGLSWFNVSSGITDGYGTGGPFVTKLAKSLQDPELVFAVGKSGVWRSENFGSSWQLFPIADSLWRSGGYYSNAQVEISEANPQIIWAGINMSDKGKIHLSMDGGFTFNPVNNYDVVPLGRLSGIETHPLEDNIAYALFSFAMAPKILRTDNYGQSWHDITGFDEDSVSKKGFPDVAVYCLQVMPFDTNIIWAGTEIGLFETTDNGSSWHYADNGLPPVALWQMKIVDDQIVVATHGRGIWSVTLPELEGYRPPDVILAPNVQKTGQSPNGNIAILANLRSEYDSTIVYLKNQNDSEFNIFLVAEQNEIGVQNLSIEYSIDTIKTVNFYLVSHKDGKEYKTGINSVILYPLKDETVTYYNDFERTDSDFVGNGFSIDTIANFSGRFLQTPHKYQNNRTLINMLLTPIVVADSLAIMKYDDIAVVEPGEENSVWGQAEFYDYVVVEATRDGFDWIPLLEGYDCRYDSLWLAVYNGNKSVSQDMFRTHEIDLQDFFEKRDTILIRFRLFADAGANGWGWAINNLDIQPKGYLSVKNKESYDIFRINNIYPNPANDFVNIDISILNHNNLEIVAYTIDGREVATIYKNSINEGNHIINWKPETNVSGTIILKFKINEIFEVKKIILVK